MGKDRDELVWVEAFTQKQTQNETVGDNFYVKRSFSQQNTGFSVVSVKFQLFPLH